MSTPVQPGDFGLVHDRSDAGLAIGLAEFLDELAQGHWRTADRASLWRHALLVESVDADGTVHAIEAWPGGARRNAYQADGVGLLWSSGHFDLTDAQRAAIVAWAVAHLGAKYSWLAYVRQAAVRLHVPFAASWLARQVERRGSYLCSQYVDAAWQAAGYHLFADRRAPYDVAPSDLADLIGA
jgi:uncharacterized protein YycO